MSLFHAAERMAEMWIPAEAGMTGRGRGKTGVGRVGVLDGGRMAGGWGSGEVVGGED